MALSAEWKRTVDDGVANKQWNAYDQLIQSETTQYNKRFSGSPNFVSLNWLLFKAIVWVESGGPKNPAWTTRPMQIGNPGDPGYEALLYGKEATRLIMSDQLKTDIKGNINEPELNIRAGIAYALNRMALSEIRSVDDLADHTVRLYTVARGDSLYLIAKKVGTTEESLKALLPNLTRLKVGQKISYRRASLQRVIAGWRSFDTTTLAQRYNVGDPAYAEKLDYVLSLFPKIN